MNITTSVCKLLFTNTFNKGQFYFSQCFKTISCFATTKIIQLFVPLLTFDSGVDQGYTTHAYYYRNISCSVFRALVVAPRPGPQALRVAGPWVVAELAEPWGPGVSYRASLARQPYNQKYKLICESIIVHGNRSVTAVFFVIPLSNLNFNELIV